MSNQRPTTQADEPQRAAHAHRPGQGMGPQGQGQTKAVLPRGFRIGAIVLGCFAGLTLIGGLVAGLVIPTITAAGQSRAKARSAANVAQLAQAVRAYASEHGSAPESRDALARLIPKYLSSYPIIGPDVSQSGVTVKVENADSWLATSQFSYIALGDISSLANPRAAMMIYEKPGLWKRGGGHIAYADGHVQYISGLQFDELVQGIDAARGQSKPK